MPSPIDMAPSRHPPPPPLFPPNFQRLSYRTDWRRVLGRTSSPESFPSRHTVVFSSTNRVMAMRSFTKLMDSAGSICLKGTRVGQTAGRTLSATPSAVTEWCFTKTNNATVTECCFTNSRRPTVRCMSLQERTTPALALSKQPRGRTCQPPPILLLGTLGRPILALFFTTVQTDEEHLSFSSLPLLLIHPLANSHWDPFSVILMIPR